MGPGSAGSARSPVPAVPSAQPASSGTAGTPGRGRETGHGSDTGFWQNEERAADRRDTGRDSSRETGGSIWSVPARDSAPARGNDDPLTSSAYSRSALGETDGRSYRVAARRSQAQTMLTDQTESFAAAQYQQGQYQAGASGEYPAASFPPARQRTGEHRQYRGDATGSAQEATVRYPAYGSQQGHQPQHSRSQPAPLSQPPLSQPSLGQPTVSQPALSQPGFGHGQGNGPGYPGQPGRGAGGGSRPGLAGGGSAPSGALDNGLPANSLPVNGPPSGQYETQQQTRSSQQRPQSRPQPAAAPLSAPVPSGGTGLSGSTGLSGGTGNSAGSRSASPGGPNPYDTGASGSYPYPGGQAYQDRPAAPAAAPANGSDDRYYRPQPAGGYPGASDQSRPEQPRPEQSRPEQPRPEQPRPGHPGYANGNQDRRERPY